MNGVAAGKNPWFRAAWRIAVACCVFTAPAVAAHALAPENVLLVVNPESRDSLTIANHYRSLRQIPPENVLYVPFDPEANITDVDTFREHILKPILAEIGDRAEKARIDCVVYSADFPWGIDVNRDVAQYMQKRKAESRDDSSDQPKWPKTLTMRGSINGLTYLAEGVMDRMPQYYMSLRANQYMRRAIPEQKDHPTLPFRSDLQFGAHGELLRAGGLRYLASMVLGVVDDENTRGNTVDEILGYLRRAAAADGTHPTGTIYFVKNDDVRSRTRHDTYPEVVAQLEKLGVRAEIVVGRMPENRPDCAGVMMGIASFDWDASGSTILPGAICEHLTSLGGVMVKPAFQTPLSEFLRHGAAASSGTVVEPYAIQAKFPFPTLHVHYVRGCTAVEAFYQSVFGPYQLLIVGDPLCRPWAEIPEPVCANLDTAEPWSGTVVLQPATAAPTSAPIARFEAYLDTRRLGSCAPGETITVDTTQFPDGYHRLRITCTLDNVAASSGSRVWEVRFANHGAVFEQQVTPSVRVREDETITFRLRCKGALALVVRSDTRVVGRCLGEEGTVTVDASTLGRGPVRLQPVALARPPQEFVFGKPVFFDVIASASEDESRETHMSQGELAPHIESGLEALGRLLQNVPRRVPIRSGSGAGSR
ncbi:MAG: hypothetical protein D6741_14535 [Planctomycetota bacterium]|nr:MAG: hypothetical protein D6741_14535 [Planctomycetota bacterium]